MISSGRALETATSYFIYYDKTEIAIKKYLKSVLKNFRIYENKRFWSRWQDFNIDKRTDRYQEKTNVNTIKITIASIAKEVAYRKKKEKTSLVERGL